VAAHWEAKDWHRAAIALAKAANEALRLGRRAEEAELLMRLADCHQRLGDADARVCTLARRISSMVQTESAQKQQAACASLLDECCTPMQRAWALTATAESLNAQYRSSEVITSLAEAIATPESMTRLIRSRSRSRLAVAGSPGQPREAVTTLESLADLPQR
jgi:hypothetical protein